MSLFAVVPLEKKLAVGSGQEKWTADWRLKTADSKNGGSMKTKILLSAILFCSCILANAQWIYTDLSQPKGQMGSTALGNKAYFAGGNGGDSAMAAVEIYDIVNENWDSIIYMSTPRFFPACAAAGNKVFFGGGMDFFTMESFDKVDIWNADSKEWTEEYLSVARMTQAVSRGNKVLFAGGVNLAAGICYDIVDIYDIGTMGWDVSHLSTPRAAMACAVIGDLAFFAGGVNVQTGQVSNRVDIYHFSTDTWTQANLSEARAFLAAAVSGSKILIAGGTNAVNTPSAVVDIFDTVTGLWTISSLSEARSFHQNNAATVLGKAYFVGGGTMDLTTYNWTSASSTIDMYCSLTDSWSTENLSLPLFNHEIAGLQDHMVAAGGDTYIAPNQAVAISNTQIYIDPDSSCIFDGLTEPIKEPKDLNIWPNPSEGIIHLQFGPDNNRTPYHVQIYNIQGQMVFERNLQYGERELNLPLSDGIYILKVLLQDVPYTKLITIQ